MSKQRVSEAFYSLSVVIVFLVPSNYWLILLFSEEDVAYKHQERFVSLLKKKKNNSNTHKKFLYCFKQVFRPFLLKGENVQKRIKNNAFFRFNKGIQLIL